MKLLLHFLLIFSYVSSKGQYLVSSNTSLESCNKIDSCITVNNFSFLFYDETKNEFFLKVDFSNFRSPDGSADNWLNSEQDTSFYFRFMFPKENFPVPASEERQSFKVNGRIFYHKTWKEQPIELTVFLPQKSLMSNTSGITTSSAENYKVNFSIPFVPGDFRDNKATIPNKQVVNINVTLGRINLLKPGMESFLSEVYSQPPR